MRYPIFKTKKKNLDTRLSKSGRPVAGHTRANNIYSNIPGTFERPIPETRNKGRKYRLNEPRSVMQTGKNQNFELQQFLHLGELGNKTHIIQLVQ